MSEPQHAVIRDAVVESVIVCDANTAALFADLDVFPGCELVEVTDADPRPCIGWSYDGTTFTPPRTPEPEPEPTPDPEPEPEPAGEGDGAEPPA